MIGTVLKERYCILEQIGSGGNGNVYLAKDMELGCQWAVKKIPLSQKKEAMLQKKLDYPFLPKMIDYIEMENECFLVMEYIQGKNLEMWLSEKKQISKKEMVTLLLKIAKILQYFHGENPPIFYGDLKPSNLICTKNGEIYLVDLGSAIRGYRKEGVLCQGTKGYAAPEMYFGKISAASDIYAFGKIMTRFLKKRSKFTYGWFSLYQIAFWCCRRKERFRYQKIENVIRKIEHIEKKDKNTNWILGVILLFLLVVVKYINFDFKNIRGFEEELTAVTDIYWQKENGKITKQSCEMVEEQLKKLQRNFKRNMEQRRILMLLALNAEYMENYENAYFYYEQLLMYEEDYDEGYAAYGLFLLRQGKIEESEQLYETYRKKETEMEGKKGRDFTIWSERLAVVDCNSD